MATQNSYHEPQLLIDEEIADLAAHMQQSIRLPKTHQNELAPVSKLPDDVLLYIFLVFRDSVYHHPKDWQQVAHVCQHWRNVAVGSPLLWTRVDGLCISHAFTRLMLARSQSARLDFTLYSSQLEKEVSTGRLATILHQIERIRALKFHNMPPNLLDTVHDILASLDGNWKASSLQSLAIGTITSSRGPRPASIRVVTDVIHPTHLLRRLNLSSGYYSWGMFPIPSLTHLCLRGQPLGGVSGAQFIDALHHMQNLESLKMNWEGTNIRQFPPTLCPQPIHLPALRILEIWSGNEDNLKSLLSLVVHPRLHQLAVNPSRHPAASVPACFKSVLSSIGEANFGLLEYLSILEQMTTISTLPWVYDPSHNNAASSGIFLHIEEEDDQPFERGTLFEFVVNVMSCMTALNCSDGILLRHIHLDSSDAPIDDFTRLFAPLLHLETIKIH